MLPDPTTGWPSESDGVQEREKEREEGVREEIRKQPRKRQRPEL